MQKLSTKSGGRGNWSRSMTTRSIKSARLSQIAKKTLVKRRKGQHLLWTNSRELQKLKKLSKKLSIAIMRFRKVPDMLVIHLIGLNKQVQSIGKSISHMPAQGKMKLQSTRPTIWGGTIRESPSPAATLLRKSSQGSIKKWKDRSLPSYNRRNNSQVRSQERRRISQIFFQMWESQQKATRNMREGALTQ